ncbi:MAG TPA: hypothetical protein PLV23_05290 [Sedimentibacter sp.]|nr:hypothetical protein [Sedimentibacter sp.]HOW23025.1 hypothetical protein [Sedimentibacter sp.]HRC80889.1 hypothetical protein [Sedimentibacter sp.]
MKDVLSQIIQIDNKAFEKQKQNENELFKIRKDYEETISTYKKEKLNDAKHKAEFIAEKIDSAIKSEEEKQKDIINRISDEIDKIYRDCEKALTEKLIKKLFMAEG